ncbi:hypothetical protein FH972_015104 [Carpinus fangiana]|uniref:Uncharacterized protein n=1 Tax=Carpinus fangiana TaxID=176857 RepID=A0A5N6REY7_9ROSI|nr:hypothetical protein FH972_015104 [Carpinus fangiana]
MRVRAFLKEWQALVRDAAAKQENYNAQVRKKSCRVMVVTSWHSALLLPCSSHLSNTDTERESCRQGITSPHKHNPFGCLIQSHTLKISILQQKKSNPSNNKIINKAKTKKPGCLKDSQRRQPTQLLSMHHLRTHQDSQVPYRSRPEIRTLSLRTPLYNPTLQQREAGTERGAATERFLR